MSDSVYLLFKSASLKDYTVCQMRGFLSRECSTRQSITLSDSTIEAHCQDPEDKYTYERRYADWDLPLQYPGRDFRNVMSQWALTMSLEAGTRNANSSTARLLSKFILGVPEHGPVTLSTLTSSLAEALAVMSSFLLAKSSMAASAVNHWDNGSMTVTPGVWEGFDASLNSQQYASGPSERWQHCFYLVLILMFVGNLVCLIYFLKDMGLVMDFTEPQNSFALAINSPFSEKMSGSCGGGPQGEQLKLGWKLVKTEDNHYYLKEGEDAEHNPLGYELRRRIRSSIKADSVL